MEIAGIFRPRKAMTLALYLSLNKWVVSLENDDDVLVAFTDDDGITGFRFPSVCNISFASMIFCNNADNITSKSLGGNSAIFILFVDSGS